MIPQEAVVHGPSLGIPEFPAHFARAQFFPEDQSLELAVLVGIAPVSPRDLSCKRPVPRRHLPWFCQDLLQDPRDPSTFRGSLFEHAWTLAMVLASSAQMSTLAEELFALSPLVPE